jgi:hypothetical protein
MIYKISKEVSINNMTASDCREESTVLVFPDSKDSDSEDWDSEDSNSDNIFFPNSSWNNFPSTSKDSSPQKPKRKAQLCRHSMIETYSSLTDVFGSDILATDPWVDFNDEFDFDSSEDDEEQFNPEFTPIEGKSEGNPDGEEGTMPLRDHNRKVEKGRVRSVSRGRQRRSKSPRVLTNEEVGQNRRNRSRSKSSFVVDRRTRSLSVPKNRSEEDENQKDSAGSSHSRKSVLPKSAATKSMSKSKGSKSKKRTGDDNSEGDHAQPQGDRSPRTPRTPINRSRNTPRDGSLKAPKTSREKSIKSPKAKRDRSSKVPRAKRDKSPKAQNTSRDKSPKSSRRKSLRSSRSKSLRSPRDKSLKVPKASRDTSSKSPRDTSAKSPRNRSRKKNDEEKSHKIQDIDKTPKTPPASKSVVGHKLFASPLPPKSYLSRDTQKRLYFGVSKLIVHRKFNIRESMSILLSDDEDSTHSNPTERKRSSSLPRGNMLLKMESEHTPSSTNRRRRCHSMVGASPSNVANL